jgi:hypothetical protein
MKEEDDRNAQRLADELARKQKARDFFTKGGGGCKRK